MQRMAKKDQQSVQQAEQSSNPFELDKQKYKRIFNSDASVFSIAKLQQPTQSVPQPSAIVFALKQQVNELRKGLSEKEAALERALKTVKLTKIKEMEVEVKLYSEECTRLRRMLDQLMKINKDERLQVHGNKQKQQQQSQQSQKSNVKGEEGGGSQEDTTTMLSSAFQVLRSDNVEMAANLKRSEEEMYAMRVVIETIERQLRNTKNENAALRRKVFAKDREIEMLKGGGDGTGSPQSNRKNQQFTVEMQLRGDLEKRMSEVASLQQQILLKDKRFMDMEKKTKEKEAEYMDKITVLSKEKQDAQMMLDREKDVVNQLMQDIDRSERRRQTVSQRAVGDGGIDDSFSGSQGNLPVSRATQRKLTLARQSSMATSIVRGNGPSEFAQSQGSSQQLVAVNSSKKRLSKVTLEEVKPLAEDLKYKLKLQRTSFAELEKVADDCDNIMIMFRVDQEEITLAQMNALLIESPCELEEQQALTLARFLIEDNNNDWVTFEAGTSSQVPFVKSALRHLLDAYTLISEDDEAQELNAIAEALAKQRGTIEDLLLRDPMSRKVKGVLCCSKKQLIGLLDSADVKLTSVQIELLFTHLYAESQTVLAIPVNSIYRVFSIENHPRVVKQRKRSSINVTRQQFEHHKMSVADSDLEEKAEEEDDDEDNNNNGDDDNHDEQEKYHSGNNIKNNEHDEDGEYEHSHFENH